jgi:Amt family ammonium transporter
MFLTWAFIKPDISMTLNGVLAGLVGVTAVLLSAQWEHFYRTYLWCSRCISIEFIDKIKIDDP